MEELPELPESQIRALAAKQLRKQRKANEAARRAAELRREAGLVSKTVYVPVRFADEVGPTIERMIAARTLAEAERNLGVVPETPHVEWHDPQG